MKKLLTLSLFSFLLLPLGVSASITASPITSNLSYGSIGSQVLELQDFLVDDGYLSSAYATGNFYGLTKQAVIDYQKAQNLPATGNVFSLTRAAIAQSLLISSSTAITASAPSMVTSGTIYLQKQTLVFSLDQNFGNGIIENQDAVGLARVISTLKAFQSKYEVYALVPTDQKDQTKLTWALDTLSANGIPFVLDVYSSDAIALGSDSINAPYDISHGREISVAQLQVYKTRYGLYLAGLRAHEVFGENAQIVGCETEAANWCDAFKQYLPTNSFYQKSFLEDYVKFANSNRMFLMFGDHYWSFDQTDALAQASHLTQNEQDLKDLSAAYPGTIVVLYDNNEYNEESRPLIDTWESIVRPYVQTGAKGFGLSDQSWMCNDELTCPATELSSWATKAFSQGGLIVETEPVWYWWNFPVGAAGPQSSNYTTSAQWVNRGYATPYLVTFATALGVTLPAADILQSSQTSQSTNSTISSNTTTSNTASTTAALSSFTISLTNACLVGSTNTNVANVSWSYALPANSWINVSDDPTFPNTDRYAKNVTGQTSVTIPNGLQSASTGASLQIVPGKTYYVSVYDGTLNASSPIKSFTVPTCAAATSSLDSFTVTPLVSCVSSSTPGSLSVSWPYALPVNSWINVGTDANYSSGHYSKNVTGLMSTTIPYGLQLSTDGSPLVIQGNMTYYISLYDGTLGNSTPNKTFDIAMCPVSG